MTTATDEEKPQVTIPQNSLFGFLPVKGIFKKIHINATLLWDVYHCEATCMLGSVRSFVLGTDLRDLKTLPPPPADPTPLYCLGLTAFPWLLQYFTGIRAGPSGSVSHSPWCQLSKPQSGGSLTWGGEGLNRANPGYSLQFCL